MGMWFEEFAVGQQFDTEPLVVTRAMILEFAALTGDDNPLHTDGELMKESQFGDIIAHGLLVQSLVIGMIARLGIMEGTTIALAEVTCRFVAPVLVGDRIEASIAISGTRPSRKPDRGVVTRQVETRNQRGTTVMVSTLVSVMRRNPPVGDA